MGRYYWDKKEEADLLKKIEVWWLKKNGYLEPNSWKSAGIRWTHGFSGRESSVSIQTSIMEDEKYLRIYYTQTNNDGSKKDFDYKVFITTTPCNYGGHRYWFICPLSRKGVYCGRRVGVLYKAGDYFGCRHCYDLTYNSRNLGGISKAAGQVISMPELDRLREEVKREYYAGKMTKKYKRYLRKQDKSLRQLMIMAKGLEGNLYR